MTTEMLRSFTSDCFARGYTAAISSAGRRGISANVQQTLDRNWEEQHEQQHEHNLQLEAGPRSQEKVIPHFNIPTYSDDIIPPLVPLGYLICSYRLKYSQLGRTPSRA
jgi:hypothetical protein